VWPKKKPRKNSQHGRSMSLCLYANLETMMDARLPVCLVAFTLLLTLCSKTDAQKAATPSTRPGQQLLSLDFNNNGQHLTAIVGQQIEIMLGTVGPPQYGKPEISSPAIRLVSTALWHTPEGAIAPGGPGFIYIFEAAEEGETQVTVPIIHADDPYWTEWAKQHTFVITIRVGPVGKNPVGLRASLTADQFNTERWKNAWTNLKNARQDFVPSMPRLRAIEIELVIANPGPESDEVTMLVAGESISKTVPVADCSRVLFLLPNGGVRVVPGQVYSIVLNGGHNVFGWKYVSDGYPKGEAFLNGEPLSRETHRSFLFRTFGGI
jgi:hypothetical protein